ncbi:D-glucuronate isomerase [Pseudarcicella hirudinis]|uniref:Uronate isomerase n=1 Tax=Pseudarcicella hirudinis TaxID=1079859 RepID=A0A1I5WK34_9BACT|nr:glucuronate isomerase [Pseudarcicella hirudinis]SFQ20040.1 D-glucuronate isomerase [Pseudarcicella hirudinis]
MKPFLDQNFLLQTETAKTLYHDFAAKMPIIDYHNHLIPQQIAENHQFSNITEAWLYGDHYKWRAMRTNGINEHFITGKASDEEKFMKWAATVPYTMRNPLYHWTHLELQRYFGITEVLNEKSAQRIYEDCSSKLNSPDFSVKNLLGKMQAKVLCTTDDPIDSLIFHQKIRESNSDIKVFPTFRPDKAMAVDDLISFDVYVNKLAEVTNINISSIGDFQNAIRKRHDFFAEMGCMLSDHGLEQIYAEEYTEKELESIFTKIRSGRTVSHQEKLQFKSAMLIFFAHLDHEKGWTQQFHLGALRNNNDRLLRTLGPDTGFDSIGDFEQARALSKFLNKLDNTNQLAKTILYNLNPRDNELFATMTGNFQDGTIAGKVQFGSGWWFLDQKDGMEKQIDALSNMGLLSRFVGMLTDSRSFLSFPRHEYFRRILCNVLGNDVENGELPNDIEWLGQMVENISYKNASEFFGFK